MLKHSPSFPAGIKILLIGMLLILAGCEKAGDEFVGEWVEINDPSSRVVISRTGNSYSWQEFNDEGGTWTAEYREGKLHLIGWGDSVASIDSASNHLILHSTKKYEYKRK